MAELVRVDRNGTKYYEGWVTCDRCGGAGGADQWKYTGFTCYKCGGTGKIQGKYRVYTPEYEEKLAERRRAKAEKWERDHAEEIAQREAERKAKEEAERRECEAEEARIKAEKAMSDYVGQIGDKIEVKATYIATARFEVPSFGGWGTDTMCIHMFRDANGNKLVWKTGCGLGENIEKGMEITLKGTVKDHSEYKEEKQTVLTRCKVQA